MPEIHDPLEECPNPSGYGAGFHQWVEEYLWPEQWVPVQHFPGAYPKGEILGERARCVNCDVIGDIAEAYPAYRGPICPSGTGF